MRLYLAGPMRGYPEGNKEAFANAAFQLRAAGHFVFNPAENKTPIGGGIRMAMATDTSWICLVAEAIAYLPNSHTSLGAMAEISLAEAIGIKSKPYEEFL